MHTAALEAEIERLRADLDLRNQTACDRKEIIAKLEREIERLQIALRYYADDGAHSGEIARRTLDGERR